MHDQNGEDMERKKMPWLLMFTIMLAIIADCKSGWRIFYMTAMSLAAYMPLLLLFMIIFVSYVFIVSIIGVFQLKRWAYYTFFILTLMLNLPVIYIYTYLLCRFGYEGPEPFYIFLIIFCSLFCAIFSLPSTRALFNNEK